jgi:hypothetical protein
MGRVYRETTPQMLTRVVTAIEARLAMVLDIAEREVAMAISARGGLEGK